MLIVIGFTLSGTVAYYVLGTGTAEHRAKLSHIPLARIGRPDEVVGAVLFLLGAEASYVTGSLLYADGGYSCGIPSYRVSTSTE